MELSKRICLFNRSSIKTNRLSVLTNTHPAKRVDWLYRITTDGKEKMSFKESIKQMAESQKMTFGFDYLNAEMWLEVFEEWLGENTSEHLGEYLWDESRQKAMLLLLMPVMRQDYDQVAAELESEGVAFYDHLTDREPR